MTSEIVIKRVWGSSVLNLQRPVRVYTIKWMKLHGRSCCWVVVVIIHHREREREGERHRMERRINNNNNTLRLSAVPWPVYLYSRAQRWGSISAYKDATPRLPFRPSCHGNDSRTVNNVPLRLSTDDGHRCSRGPYHNLPIHVLTWPLCH
jgi:hypothetical protein